jgi:hypothetical protein
MECAFVEWMHGQNNLAFISIYFIVIILLIAN